MRLDSSTICSAKLSASSRDLKRRDSGWACCRRLTGHHHCRWSGKYIVALLGHTVEGKQSEGELTPRNLRECEAEAVALLCCAAFGLPGVECCRGYIQNWWGAGNPIPERSTQRLLKVADQILKGARQGRRTRRPGE